MYTFSANTVIESAKINANFAELQDDIATTPPIGSVIPYAGSAAPTGYLIADGAEISRTTYSDLFAVVGTTYGVGNGTTTFTLPNLKGKVPVGLDSSQTEFDALGETGGAKTHTLTTNEIPSHQHMMTDSAGSRPSRFGAGSSGFGQVGSASAAADTPYFYTGYAGGGAAHNNLQPYITLNYLIRY